MAAEGPLITGASKVHLKHRNRSGNNTVTALDTKHNLKVKAEIKEKKEHKKE